MRALAFGAAAAITLATTPARATGFHEMGQEHVASDRTQIDVSGYLRTRGHVRMPSNLTHLDMRLRTDVAAYAPGTTVGVKARFDVLDARLDAPVDERALVRGRRAYGQALLPVGAFVVGRMGTHWGLGMLANGGDCLDCDSVDATDRALFVTAIAGHLWVLAYDTPGTVTFAASRWFDDESRVRRTAAGKTTIEYGALGSHRQHRDLRVTAADAFARLTSPWVRAGAEVAYVGARVDRPEIAPSVLLRAPIDNHQIGAALETDVGPSGGAASAGIDAGYASGSSGGPVPFRFHSDYRIDRILFREIVGAVTDAAYARPHARVRVARGQHANLEAQVAAVGSWSHAPLGVEVDPSIVLALHGFVAALDYAALFPVPSVVRSPVTRPEQLVRVRLVFSF